MPTPSHRRRGRLLSLLLVAAGLLGGVFGAVAAGNARRDAVLDAERRAFDRSAGDVTSGVATSLRRNTDLIVASSAFIASSHLASSHSVSNREFQSWFNQGALDRYSGLMGLGYVERVAHADLPAFAAEVAADPAPLTTGEFTLVPPGPRAEYCLIRLSAKGASAVPIKLHSGTDVCRAPGFGSVFAEVRRTGDVAVMPLPDAGSPQDQPARSNAAVGTFGTAFSVIAPVRDAGAAPADPDGFRGWVLGLFDGPGIVRALPRLNADLDLSLSWRDGDRQTVIAERPVAIRGASFESEQTFFADGEWTMTLRGSAAGAHASARSQQRVVLGSIVAFTVLALAFVWLLAGGRNRALRLVDQKTDQLQFQALHDGLTGLPNRTLILDRAEQKLRRSRREGVAAAAMFLDIDNFKTINDTLGHAAGDGLLRTVAERLRGAVRDSDSVGRLGGDEFVVLADGGDLPGWAEILVQRILDAMAEPVHLDGLGDVPLTVGVSIGIAMGDRPDADTLLRDADVALYEAKAAGKGGYVIFEPNMQLIVRDKLALEMDLFNAIGSDQFYLVYQPTFSLDSRAVTGVEALIRWKHPTRGIVTPEQFIPLSEEHGTIVPIGDWVLRTACRQAAEWRRGGHPLAVAVNISVRQLESTVDLVASVRSALAGSGLEPGSLILEITESSLMLKPEATVARLVALKALGVRLAIDDFGTGHSSMAYLQKFPVDTLKIDRSFVSQMGHSLQSNALVHTLVQLGKALGIETLAEGIEEADQLDRLQAEHCDSGQGFIFSRPLDAADIIPFLEGHPTQAPPVAALPGG